MSACTLASRPVSAFLTFSALASVISAIAASSPLKHLCKRVLFKRPGVAVRFACLAAHSGPGRCASRADFCTLRGMNLSAFALVVAAACLHALWNLAAKRVSGNVGVLWLGLCLSGVLLAPFALASAVQSFDLAGLPYIVATGLIHAAYFAFLA